MNIDPFDDKGQFCDKGPAYLSAIFVSNENERKIAEQSISDVVEQFPNRRVVAPIREASTFFPLKETKVTIKIIIKTTHTDTKSIAGIVAVINV